MKNFARVLALMLIAATLLAFASCGADNEAEQPTTAAATSVVENTEENGETTAKATATNTKATAVKTTKKVAATITNMAGYSTISPLITRTTNNRGNATAKFVKSLKGYDMTIMQAFEPARGGKIYEADQWCIDQVKNDYGIKVTYDGFFTNYNEKLTASLSARSADAEIYMVQDFNFASYFQKGYLCDLTNAMNTAGVDFRDPWYNANAREFLNINYKQYGWILSGVSYTFPYGILYNKNIIKKAKLTDPETLVKNGQWTWDTLVKYSKKLTTSNIIGFGSANVTQMLGSMVATKGSSLVSVKKGKEPAPNISNQTCKDCLATLSQWCKTGGICNTFANQDWTAPKVTFANRKVAMLYSSHDAFQHLYNNKSFTDSIGFVPFPTEKASKKFTNVCIPQFIWFIPSQHKSEADKILFSVNEFYRQNYRFAQRNFDINWNTYFDDKKTLEMECNMMYGRGQFNNVYDWRDVCETASGSGTCTSSSVINYAIENNGDVAGAISKYQTALNKGYSATWKGYRVTGNV